ncbi:FAD-dependent oxidoreductase [Egicoccus halophilus]|uniref:3-oxosteroid 1-dehydrogenase n=1 Tax=Egicoccus halophilus TaxID=1670830 RepID=A0A8J3AAZ7_9ACTN|nr:FAD-dependent oxidoreductase [Egicoccus halophilus]GGI07101.1 putative 3-ketosteroid 1-dehydrogenase or fumarate reductase/succinate dehydrogenase [Egicoccus halophilus]
MRNVDLVVIGSGGGGMAAALAGARAGMRTVLFEKSPHYGGSTALSGGGMWLPRNSVLAERGLTDTRERVLTYLRHTVGDDVPEARLAAFVDHAPEATDLLRRATPLAFTHMREYADYYPELPGGSAIGRSIEPAPFDATRLGSDRDRLNPPALEAPFPMPVTSSAYKWMNLAARKPRGVWAGASALAKGLGGKAAGHEWIAGGQALIAGLRLGLHAAGVTLRTSAPLRDLLIEDGRVVGVVVELDGEATEVRAAAGVVLAAGGFERNQQMRHEYQSPVLDTEWSSAHRDNTGDVIRLADRIGADLDLMDQAWWFPCIPTPGRMPAPLLAERSLPGSIIVNAAGERFFNEAMSYMEAGQEILGAHRDDDPHVPAWLVFDQRYRNRYAFGGGILPRQPLPKAWYDAGVVHRADSVETLAAAVGLPPQRLEATIERFNLLARHGHDEDFGKGKSAYDRYYGDPTVSPNPCLAPIEHGPFYAVKVVPGDLGTCGGLRADEHARVLRADGTAIDGLYATGNVAANAFGKVYPGPGATIGSAVTFGSLAVRHLSSRTTAPATA